MPTTAHALERQVAEWLAGRKLVVISHREPFAHRWHDGGIVCSAPNGGLVTALDPVLRACGGTWIAHGDADADFAVTDRRGRFSVPPPALAAGESGSGYTLQRLRVPPSELNGFYRGFANEGLWPLCHDRVAVEPAFRPADWRAYRAVNRRFARAVLAEVGRNPAVVLVQDYHFSLLPRMLKDANPSLVVAHFWHVPWPSADVLATCPYAGKLLDGLLANDVLGFQTAADQRAFLEAAARAGCQTIGDEARDRRGHRTRVHCIPIGVDATALDRDALRPVVEADAERLRADLGLRGQMVLLGVDRLDYTKGIPERLRAFRRLLERHPEHLRRVSFVQIGSPSRGEVPAYRRFQAEVQRLAGDVNRRFGGDGWEPVRLLPTNHAREALLAAYRMATACVVSPLHDGMNLVAKEFVAARPDRNGALVLSRFAGAAHELTDALQIDPRDADVFAESLHRALVLPRPDRRRRMDGMRRAVFERTVYDWAGDLIGTAARISVARPIDKWQRTVFDMTG